MKYKSISISTSVLLLLMGSGEVLAKVSDKMASQLGKNLTEIGAEKAANKNGSIPKYMGGLKEDVNADPLVDIYANEKPLFVINSKNLSKYENQLSDGQKALFKKFPDSYTMPVYKTHRTSSYPAHITNKAQSNAVTSELLDGGNGLSNFDESIPFAIPKSGLEVIWNHVSRYRGGSIERNSAQAPVQRDGSFTAVRVRSQLTAPQYLKDGFSKKEDDNILFYFTQAIKSPARLTGNVLLVHETIDQVNQPRMAWSYNAGQRRVRRAPQIGYDAPSAASDGLRTADQVDMYNGAPDKYNWKLVGKQEMYIPYNSYKLANPELDYDEIIKSGHIDQDLTRYELHRVWKVEATLKEGARHVYAKRTFYIDEDSWQIAIADHYDNRGELWKASEGHALQFVNANTPWYVSTTTYDLFSGRYLVELNNEEKDPFKFGKQMKRKSFTASAIRRQGRR
ncbi:MAG: DUF1329 domain-containing protein [Bermanella sp.]